MKKENIQSRNRKLSAKARKKSTSSSHFAPIADMIKPLEKMYGSYAGMHAAAAMGAAGMSSYYMPNAAAAAAAAGSAAAAVAGAAGAGSTPTSAAQFAGAGMHMMSSALGGFGASAACPPSFGGMVRELLPHQTRPPFACLVQFFQKAVHAWQSQSGEERRRRRRRGSCSSFHKSFPGYFSSLLLLLLPPLLTINISAGD